MSRALSSMSVVAVVMMSISCSESDKGPQQDKGTLQDKGSSNPIKTKCASVCAIDSSDHCYMWTYIESGTGRRLTANQACIQKCEKDAAAAEQGHLAGCGICVAEGIKYTHKTDSYCQSGRPDITCCYGVASTRTPDSPECLTRCLKPDCGRTF